MIDNKMNKSVFTRTLNGQRNLVVDNIDVNEKIRIESAFPTAEEVLVSDITTAPTSTQYKALTPSMIGLENLTAGTNITYTSGDTTYNGEVAQTMNSVNTTYSAGDGLDLTGTTFSADLKSGSGLVITSGEIDLSSVPNSALANSSITIGSTSISLGATASDLDMDGGDIENANLTTCESISMSGNIDMNVNDISDVSDIVFNDGAVTTLLTGNSYGGSGNETTATYLDLSSAKNVYPTLYPNKVSPYLSFISYDPAGSTAKALTTSYSTMYSPYLSTSFVARGASIEVQLQTYNYTISGNRWLYLRLTDGTGTSEWAGSTGTGGGYGTGTRSTERLIHYSDETDKQTTNLSWVLTGLTPGNTYVVNPQAKTSSTTNYLYAGGSYPANIMRVIQV